MFPSRVIVLKLSERKFLGDLSKKPKSFKAIYIYASESFHYTLSGNDMVCRGLSHRSHILSYISD